jgi:ribosomal protein S8
MIKANVISKINNALNNKKLFVKIEETNSNVQFAQCLLNLNKIEKFFIKNKEIILFFIYNGFWIKIPTLRKLFPINSKLSVPFKKFKTIFKNNDNVIVNTPLGLLTKEYAILYKTGGFPLCMIE